MKKRWHIPDRLYEALPWLYIAIGLVTALVVRSAVAIFSGLIMVSAGGAIWSMRVRYRRERQRPEWQDSVEGRVADRRRAETGLVQLSWNASFDCGHPVIDAQHRRLVGIGNELINAALTKRPKAQVASLLVELVEHVAEHFQTEEALMAALHKPLPEAHLKVHRALLAKASAMRDEFLVGPVPLKDLIAFVTVDVVSEHIVKEDLKFAATVL